MRKECKTLKTFKIYTRNEIHALQHCTGATDYSSRGAGQFGISGELLVPINRRRLACLLLVLAAVAPGDHTHSSVGGWSPVTRVHL